jgi:hypothetical protein
VGRRVITWGKSGTVGTKKNCMKREKYEGEKKNRGKKKKKEKKVK